MADPGLQVRRRPASSTGRKGRRRARIQGGRKPSTAAAHRRRLERSSPRQAPPATSGWSPRHRYSFPVLSHFARDVLLVPVSTVSSEATFSTVGRIIEERRSSLAPEAEMVEAITCLKDWKRAEERKQHQLEDPEIELAAADMEI